MHGVAWGFRVRGVNGMGMVVELSLMLMIRPSILVVAQDVLAARARTSMIARHQYQMLREGRDFFHEFANNDARTASDANELNLHTSGYCDHAQA
jgi:hypothetical protein